MSTATLTQQTTVLTPQQLLDHWQGHRRLTRKMIEKFPEDKLFTYSIGGMRPFGEFIVEFLDMGVPGVRGAVTGKWQGIDDMSHRNRKDVPTNKAELLKKWDEATEELNTLFPQIPAERFQEMDRAFGQWDGPIYFFIFYWIDNEIHHRAQGYVYLRSLGIEPPPFWER